ncbi:PREDICTED: Retrovirus-related Pol poly from transposon TNT, partial [Prunus dulcis]
MSLSNERFMKEELINLRMKEGGNLTEHVNTFDMCIAGLQKVDVVYSTEDVAMMLWAPLPPSYEHFRKMLMIGKIILNFEEVVQDLVHHTLAQNFGDSSQVKIKMQDGVVGSLTE